MIGFETIGNATLIIMNETFEEVIMVDVAIGEIVGAD